MNNIVKRVYIAAAKYKYITTISNPPNIPINYIRVYASPSPYPLSAYEAYSIGLLMPEYTNE